MPDRTPSYIDVAVAAPLHQTLTYAVPDKHGPLSVGQRLLVPLGRRMVTGYLLGQVEEPAADFKIRSIAGVCEEFPVFPAGMLPFFRWIARYYHYPLGEVIKGALPGGLTARTNRQIILTEEGKKQIAPADLKKFADTKGVAELLEKGRLSPGASRTLLRTKSKKLIEKWGDLGWCRIDRELLGETVRQKTETCVTLICNDLELKARENELKPSEKKVLALLAELAAPCAVEVARRDLVKIYPAAGKPLKGLAEKKIIRLFERPVYRDPFGDPPHFFPKPAQLTPDQIQVLSLLEPAIGRKEFFPFLLHGVTGSGKTEVYLRASETALATGRSVLVLVPEIALATQLESHFISRFGDEVALLHSGLSTGERFDQWLRIMQRKARIVIGARSAIYAPLADPGLIIVDEEHDSAYKQEEGLRYQARDLAVLRANMQGAVVLLGSATPAVISYYHAGSGKYRLLELPTRVEDRAMPGVEIVDLKKVNTVSGRPPLFSPELTRSIRENLAQGDQTMLFLNRRGFANCMICADCGHPVECRQCRVSLTYHKGRNELICHYCGYTVTSNTVCGNCRSIRLNGIGFGTERVQEELVSLFPKARIARLDRDTTKNRRDFMAVLKAMHQQEIDILVGTQMITKGHHFPNVTLVGIVWADAGLGLPDFKAGERTFQLLSQVTGRAGRGEKPGRVIVQTYQPEHYSIRTAQLHDYRSFYQKEIGLRSSLQFPPFSRLINLALDAEEEESVKSAAQDLARQALEYSRRSRTVEVLGPAPSPISRIRGRYRWQLFLKGAEIEALHHICRQLVEAHEQRKTQVKLSVDVDPENML